MINAKTAKLTVTTALELKGWGERWEQDFRTHTTQVDDFTLNFTQDIDGYLESVEIVHTPTKAVYRAGMHIKGRPAPAGWIQDTMTALYKEMWEQLKDLEPKEEIELDPWLGDLSTLF